MGTDNRISIDAKEPCSERLAYWLVIAVWSLFAFVLGAPVQAQTPPPGTIIPNTINGTAILAGNPILIGPSNTVQVVVSAGVGATLTTPQTVISYPGASVTFPHTLTNGAAAETYTLAVTDLPAGFNFATLTILPDANGDGVPDNLVPIASTGLLAANQVFRFVVVATVPAGAPIGSSDQIRVEANAPSLGTPLVNIDTVNVQAVPLPPDPCALTFNKQISQTQGPSPSPRLTISIAYNNPVCPGGTKTNLQISDVLAPEFSYIPGSARWNQLPGVVLTDGVTGTDIQGDTAPLQIAYSFAASSPRTVLATIAVVESGGGGTITFDVTAVSGLPVATRINNTASVRFETGGNSRNLQSNQVSYLVTGVLDVILIGETIPVGIPGEDVPFRNRVTNRGTIADTYNITLSGSDFPAGTTFQLFRADGTTPLPDTNGDGIPDTGVVGPGQTIEIVVKARFPATTAGGPFKVLKTARSITASSVFSSDLDRVNTTSKTCSINMDPDHAGRVGIGRTIVYPHIITNRGNCDETVTFPGVFKTDTLSTWSSLAYLDEGTFAKQAKVAGLVDGTDQLISNATSFVLRPGESQRVLIKVTASMSAIIGDANTTTLIAVSTSNPQLRVVDITTVPADGGIGIDDVLVNHTDSSRRVPTIWAVIGRDLFLRADAPSCNARPDVIETRTVILLGPNGEREELVATETGPNTGVFIVAAVPVRRPPVTPLNNIVEGRAADQMDLEVIGCGRRITTTVTLIDPAGVVFDSRSNEPVPGAIVRLVTATGGVCSSTLASVSMLNMATGQLTASPNPVTTGADGRFEFPVVAQGSYCVLVTTPNGYTFTSTVAYTDLPPGRNILATGPTSGGSYGGSFPVDISTGPVAVDIPVDAGIVSGLFVQKTAQREVVEPGETLDYTVRVKNQSGLTLDRGDVLLTDSLPAGFTYVTGTARVAGKSIADPAGKGGPTLVFTIGHMLRDQEVTLTYRVRVGPGAMQGDGINRIQASYQATGTTLVARSNIATARVRVQGGVFSDKAYLVGKIYADCNANGQQDAGEVGVPAVRFFLEDGTSVITDSEGKYSLYGLTARTRVLKVDTTTLPTGARLTAFGNRSGGKAESRFVDLKNGELHRADFALEGCGDALKAEVDARRKAARDSNAEIEGRLQQKLETDPKASLITDPKALPATGTLGQASGGGVSMITPLDPSKSPASAAPELAPLSPGLQMELADQRRKRAARAPKAPELPLESLLEGLDNTLGFISIKDGDKLPFAQATIRVKGIEGARFKLDVNGVEIGTDRVGKRTAIAELKLQAWEYFGVDLKPGSNAIKVTQYDPFGNERGVVAISVIAPDKLGKLFIDLPKGGAIADGKTAASIGVRLADDKGVPVTVRTPITLETNNGTWKLEDLDPREPGLQTFIEGGSATFSLLPPSVPGDANIRVSSGVLEAEAQLDFMPDLRDMIAAGVIEGVLNLRKLNTNAMVPARAQDGFEQELQHFSRSSGDGKRDASARAAFFLKGKVKGEYLLTLAYDSDKDGRERLFRDIQPDEFYPVYGDGSVRGFDAQSTQRLYLRVDKQKSWLLYGDFATMGDGSARRLANYNRSLTGAKAHFEEGRVSANVFASRDSTRQIIEELRANGTSGPYTLSSIKGLINSEKVEILTRDRNQPSLIISAAIQNRFTDYELEPFTGRILFRAPVPSLDADLNPISIRVTYEIDQGGQDFWVAGGDVQVKVNDKVEIGATYVKDKNPVEPFEMRGVNATVKLTERTLLTGEFAQTEKPLGSTGSSFLNGNASAASTGPLKGNAQRVELKHRSEGFDAEVYAGRSDAGFDNAGASISRGREEAGAKANIRIDAKTRATLEALHTGDRTSNSKRHGIQATVEHSLDNGLRLEGGVRYAKETGASALPAYPNELNTGSAGTTPNEVTSVRGRVTGPMPGVKDATIYGELEVDVKDAGRKIAAIGGDYLLGNKGRVYARHEFISSLTGPYGLNSSQRQNSTVFGVDTDYMKDGKLFSEYRIRDALSGGDAEAAIGLRNLWTLGEGLKLGTGFERIHALSGKGEAESTAITLGLEYTANPLWKGTARLELRDGATSDSILSTLGFASKLNRDWTFLGRNTFSLVKQRGTSNGEVMQDRLQAGVAYRETDSNVWSGLARVEHRSEKDTTQPGLELKRSVEILSLHANYQPRRPFTLSGRYAAKIASDKSNGLVTKSNAQLVSGRAIWEFAPRFDLSINLATMFGQGAQKRQYGLGFEVGYMLTDNLWLSGGYNVFGFKDDDLVAGDYTNKGAFVRLRYKFDEELLERAMPGKDKKVAAAESGKAP